MTSKNERHVPSGAVSVSVKDGVVTLDGKAHHHFQAAAAKRAVEGAPGVKGIVNNIKIVDDPIPGEIAARIEGALQVKGLDAGAHVTVSSHGHTVFLRGWVPNWEALREAEDTAWNTDGVSQVVDRLVLRSPG